MFTKEITVNNPYSYNTALFLTQNNGKSWKRLELPEVNQEIGGGDPSIVWGENGVIYFSSIVFVKEANNKKRLKVFVYTSKDKGETWSKNTDIFGNKKGLDHPVIRYNPKNTSPVTMFASGGNGIASTQVVSLNEKLLRKNSFTHGFGNEMNNNLGSGVLLDNNKVVFIQTKNMSELRSVSTSDFGKTFKETTITKKCIPYGFPMLSFDNSGKSKHNRLYAVWSERGDVGTQIFMSYSDDTALTWSDKQQISSNSESINLMPQIDVNNNGDILIAWMSSKSDQELTCYNVNYALSNNNGISFDQNSLTKEKYCASTKQNGAVVQKWKLGGDYFGIDSDSSGDFHIAWSDSRSKVYQIWYSKISK